MRVGLVCALLAAATVHAESTVFNGDPLTIVETVGSQYARIEPVLVGSDGTTPALRLTTHTVPPNPESVGAYGARARWWPVAAEKGDLILVSVWLRCVEPVDGECITRFVVERNTDPYTKSSDPILAIGPQWQNARFAFRMAEGYAARGYRLEFWLGYQKQAFEVAGFDVNNYGPDANPVDLGVESGYAGHAPDAAWRAAAAGRIDKLRKGDLVVEVRDAQGRPVPGAHVRARMTRHEFGFGSAVTAAGLLDPGATNDVYREKVKELFNTVVFENDLKWPSWERERARPLQAIGWLNANGIGRVRGHTLVWPGWQYLPQSIQALRNDPETLRARVVEHVRDEASALSGRLIEWDVVNELTTNRDLQNVLGEGVVADWFRAARESDANAGLCLNDYNILSAGGANIPHQNYYFNALRGLIDAGVPVTCAGMQGHFSTPTAPERMLQVLDRFAQLGLRLRITEYDINTADEQLQADFTRDILTVAFSHPAVDQFLMWGFWEGRHWRPDAAMYRRDWTEKPNGAIWRKMLFEEWWTDDSGEANGEGRFTTRGFTGDYVVEVSLGDRRASVEAKLSARGETVVIPLP